MQGDITFSDPFFHRREMTIISSRNSQQANFTRIIALMESGKVNTDPWITHRARYDALPELFPQWLAPESGMIKGVVEF
jgi:threonine dehydrogenase-like Zn-dependent dehydrogenase